LKNTRDRGTAHFTDELQKRDRVNAEKIGIHRTAVSFAKVIENHLALFYCRGSRILIETDPPERVHRKLDIGD